LVRKLFFARYQLCLNLKPSLNNLPKAKDKHIKVAECESTKFGYVVADLKTFV
jgi:hypothetical protein